MQSPSQLEPPSPNRRKRRKLATGSLFALGLLFLFALLFAGDREDGLLLGGTFEADSVGQARGTDAVVQGSPELLVVAGSGVKASTPPGSVRLQTLGSLGFEANVSEVRQHVVQAGETVGSLAREYGISEETVLSANGLSGRDALQPGQRVLILPLSGTLHLVRPYDTLSEIASWYQAAAQDIVYINNLESPEKIVAGDLLIIPGGKEPSSLPSGRLTPIANSYFIYPIPAPHRVTQGAHHYNAIDFSNGVCGEPVYAAAGGAVQRTEYGSIPGNFVRILHPNGVVTFYGHLSQILAAPGARVFQGEIIGYTGQTGYATGCHVHFEVRGARNPFL